MGMNTASATYNGQPVVILARDSDPRASVWVRFVSDPDRSAFVAPSELVAA